MNNQITVYQVQAFTYQNIGGSPTSVVLTADHLTEDQMRQIARTMPASHTAFITEAADQDSDINIRFFTPGGEIKNCGHATIAAHYLLTVQKGISRDYTARQRTQTGIQEAHIRCQTDGISVSFEQNEIAFSDAENEVVEALLAVLNLSAADLLPSYPIVLASPGANRFLLPVKSRQILDNLSPDFSAMKTLCQRTNSIGCFAFTLEETAETLQAWARMFAPAIGVNEDIINGNSSGCLGAYLLTRSNREALTLAVFQGHTLGAVGKVSVTAQRHSRKIKTFVGGTADITGQLEVDIPVS